MLYNHARKCYWNNMGVWGNGSPVNSFQDRLVEELSKLTNIKKNNERKKR